MNELLNAKAFMEKAAGYGSVLGLSSITELMNRMGNPQDELKIIHVAGTNGKGSTCAFLQSVLTKAGYRVGLYTSPAVFSYRERFRINDQWIEEDCLYTYMNRIQALCDEMVADGFTHPTLFEIETALALLYFKEKECQLVILEVGMGGETDATNVIGSSLCSVFASIGRDHMQFLGESIVEIARIKAGIMKECGQAVSIWQEKEVESVLHTEANRCRANLTIASKDDVTIHSKVPLVFSYKEFSNIEVTMLGSYQLDNCVLALETICKLRTLGYTLPIEVIREGIKKTYWPGRMEKICQNPETYIDGAHNLPAALRLAETIENNFTNKRITYIIGVLADKEHREMMDVLLPKANHIITVTSSNSRKLPAAELTKEIADVGYHAVTADSIAFAFEMAVDFSDDIILAFGSLSYLQEFLNGVVQWTKEHKDV